MGAMETDELWSRVAARIHANCGWSLRPLAGLGQPREGRRTWLAESIGQPEPGTVIVKASANPFAPTRAAWTANAMGLLGERGYPVPALLWHGALDGRWFVVVQARVPGQPPHTLDAPTLDRLLALVELQADQAYRLGEGGWDVSWWIGVVLFEDWEHWWEAAEAAAPQASRRLRRFLEPAWATASPPLMWCMATSTSPTCWPPTARSPACWTGTTSGLAGGPPTSPGCCSTGTACGWPARSSPSG